MENIEDKLNSYRLRKKRKEKLYQIKNTIKGFFMSSQKDENENGQTISNIQYSVEYFPNPVRNLATVDEVIDDKVVSSEEEEESQIGDNNTDMFLQCLLRFVYIAFWISLYIIAIELQFGIVFLMISALIGIYVNTRTGPRKRNEISAYSVFNKNCESIDGTLKAEQFEREIGIR